MHRKSIVLLIVATIVAVVAGFTAARDNTANDPKHERDRLVLAKLTRDMIQAFDKRDAAAIAVHWTEDGEFIRNDGEPIRGRAAIEKGYAEFFKTLKGQPKLEIQSEAVHFPSADVAVTEATLRLKNADGDSVASGRQDTVLVREAGRWKVAMVHEWDGDLGLDASLKELDWLIGTWQAVTRDGQVSVTYRWDENKAFIRGKYTVKEGTKVIESGTEMIGKDNAKGKIRSWVFQSDGGFGGGLWAREGKNWSVDAHAVRADGSELTATILYLHVAPNTVTWQAVNQAQGGVPVADTPPLKLTKQKPAK